MQNEFVIAKCDVYCKWKGAPPRYRCFVNGELFTERTWIWDGMYLEESLQILGPPDKYEIRYELVEPGSAKLKITNLRIESGPAIITPEGRVQIYIPESRL